MMYDLKLEQADVSVLAQALGELPLKVAFNAYVRLQQQVQAQDAANAVEVPSGKE